MLSLISKICFLLGGHIYEAYQIRDRINEFATRIFPLRERFLPLYCSINFLILVIYPGQKFLGARPSLVISYPKIFTVSSSVILLKSSSFSNSTFSAVCVRGNSFVFLLFILALEALS